MRKMRTLNKQLLSNEPNHKTYLFSGNLKKFILIKIHSK